MTYKFTRVILSEGIVFNNENYSKGFYLPVPACQYVLLQQKPYN